VPVSGAGHAPSPTPAADVNPVLLGFLRSLEASGPQAAADFTRA
jgi:hypothetical protein